MIAVRAVFVTLNFGNGCMGIFLMSSFITARRYSKKENEYAEYEPKKFHGTNVKKNCQLNIIFLLPSAVFSKTL